MAVFRENQQQHPLHTLGCHLNEQEETAVAQWWVVAECRVKAEHVPHSILTRTYPDGLSVSMQSSLHWSEKRTSFSRLFIMELTSWNLRREAALTVEYFSQTGTDL